VTYETLERFGADSVPLDDVSPLLEDVRGGYPWDDNPPLRETVDELREQVEDCLRTFGTWVGELHVKLDSIITDMLKIGVQPSEAPIPEEITVRDEEEEIWNARVQADRLTMQAEALDEGVNYIKGALEAMENVDMCLSSVPEHRVEETLERMEQAFWTLVACKYDLLEERESVEREIDQVFTDKPWAFSGADEG